MPDRRTEPANFLERLFGYSHWILCRVIAYCSPSTSTTQQTLRDISYFLGM
jgi:hypothetical protein